MSDDTQTPGSDETQANRSGSDNSTAKKSNAGLIGLLVVVGVLAIAALLLLPWFLRGSHQSGVVSAVKSAGGRASYGFRLSDDATYGFNEKKGGERGFVENMMGEAYTEKLTQVIWNKTSFDSGLISKIAKLPALEIIDLQGPTQKDHKTASTNLSDTDFEKLCTCSTIKRLWVNGGQVSDSGAAFLSGLPELASLSLEGTQITDVALDTIGTQANLKRLYLKDTVVTDKGVAQLKGLSKLQGIGLEGTKVTDKSIDQLLQLVDLEEVRFDDTAVTGAGISKLAALPKLKELSLEGTSISDGDLTWLADCANLEKVWLSRTQVTDGLLSTLRKMPKLLLVHLNGTPVTRDGWATMRRQLRNAQVQIEAYEELVETK